MQGLIVEVVKGSNILPFLSELASLRTTVFKEYPYLYIADVEHERQYLATYAQCNDFILILVLDGNKVVGASTALPLRFETECCTRAFYNSAYDIKDIFYCGESVLLPEYRNNGLYKSLFNYREEEAKRQGYKFTAFCAVNRTEDDPRKPNGYMPLNVIWEKYGYIRLNNTKAYFTWLERDEVNPSSKEMIFWIKQL